MNSLRLLARASLGASRLRLRRFSDATSDGNESPEGGAAEGNADENERQVETQQSESGGVETFSSEEGDEVKKSAPIELGFGEFLSSVGFKESDLNSWFDRQKFEDEELPVLEELSPSEIKLREKAKRRVEELRKQKELADSRVRVVDRFGNAYAMGGRKTSAARVWIREGEGKIQINGRSHDNYFPLLDHRVLILEPFVATGTLGKFDVRASVSGGGVTGQAGAVRHGISKALQLFNPELRPPLRSGGMLTRDPRAVERKKPGKAKARKSYQWGKR